MNWRLVTPAIASTLLLLQTFNVLITSLFESGQWSPIFSIVFYKDISKNNEHGNGSMSLDATVLRENRSINSQWKPSRQSKHTILIWTKFYTESVWSTNPSKNPFENAFCNYRHCRVTYDKTQYVSADVILFHCRNLFTDWPAIRPSNQLYGVLCMESPLYSSLALFDGVLNMTISYRRDSDIFTPYHRLVRRREPPTAGVMAKPVVSLNSRTGDVLWPVSHCSTYSKRELYVEKLMTYIQVDVYGKCGNYTCPQSNKTCEFMFSRKYKFLLSFENSYCEDYVTEKFFKAYWLELIPIVFGNVDYSRYYPPHSFIDVRDYKSPKDLANYLNYLKTNERAFNAYFQWKLTHLTPRANWFDMLYCGLCELLKNNTFSNTYVKPDVWWREQKCDSDIMAKLLNSSSSLSNS